MKKLLTPITIFLLVACQPSELDRCIEANLEEREEFDLINKWIPYNKEYNKIYNDNYELFRTGELTYEEFDKSTAPSLEAFYDLLTEDEKKVYSGVKYHDWENEVDYTDEEVIQQIKTLTANFIKSYTDKAEKFCNMQGIY